MDTYGVDEDHAFVLQFQELGHEGHVVFEFIEQTGNFCGLNLDYERFGALDALSRNHQVTKACKKMHGVIAVYKLILTL